MQTGRAFAPVAQRIDRVDARGVPGRKKSERDPGDEGSQSGDREHGRVERNLIAARDPIARETGEEQFQTPTADQDAANSAKSDEQERLDEMTARNRGSAGAERKTDRDFALPRRGANELQAGDVRAGDEQDEQRRADDEEQTFPIIADDDVAQRADREVPAFVKFWVALGESRGNRRHLRLRRRAGNSGLQFPDHRPETRVRDRVLAAFVRQNPPDR